MDAIKQIISALAGEDISPANREKIIGLTEKLREALREWQVADLPDFDRVSIVLPDGFNPIAPVAVVPFLEPPAEIVPTEAPPTEPAAAPPKATPIAAPIAFAVPRPPANIREIAPEPDRVVETEVPACTETIVWELPQPTEEVLPTAAVETVVTDEQPAAPADIIAANAQAANETISPILQPAAPTAEEPAISLPPAMQMMEALMADLPLPSTILAEEAPEPVQPLELTIDEEMLEEQLALEEAPKTMDLPDVDPAPITPVSHAPYLPKSMQLEHMEDLMVLPKPRPAAPVRVAEPVLATQTVEVNERLQTRRRELSELLQEPRITDLRKGISINERYQYIQNLFRTDEAMFERSIKTLNSFNILAEAQYWMQRELVIKLGWNDEDELVQQFYQLVSRRFRSI